MDNAFERARAAYGTGAYDDATLEFLFPQLKESRDEQIRKAMLQHFKNKTKEKWCNIPVKDIISCLEKQEWSEEDEDKLEQCIRIVSGWEGDYDIVKSPYSNFLKSLRPSWKPSKEQMNALQNAVALAAGNKVLAGLYEQLKQL